MRTFCRLLRHQSEEPILSDVPTEEDIQRAVELLIAKNEESNYQRLGRRASQMLRKERRTRRGFEKRLMRRWGNAIDGYDKFVILARGLGEDFNRKHRPSAAANNDYVFEALTRIHARACLVASEVRALMVSGHASGALARWRSLHELAVVAYFLAEHGNEVAERYMLHEVIRSTKDAAKYEKHHEALGYDPLSPKEIRRLQDMRDHLIERFGKSFGKDYGWAAGVLSGDPTFDRIEESVGMAHWRPHFGMASHSVHAGFKGITFDIGQMKGSGCANIALAGPSHAGLADPGQSAAISLMNCTVALLNLRIEPETVIGLKILQRLVEEVSEAFVVAHDEFKRDEERYPL